MWLQADHALLRCAVLCCCSATMCSRWMCCARACKQMLLWGLAGRSHCVCVHSQRRLS